MLQRGCRAERLARTFIVCILRREGGKGLVRSIILSWSTAELLVTQWRPVALSVSNCRWHLLGSTCRPRGLKRSCAPSREIERCSNRSPAAVLTQTPRRCLLASSWITAVVTVYTQPPLDGQDTGKNRALQGRDVTADADWPQSPAGAPCRRSLL
jgi:hypothetical protein